MRVSVTLTDDVNMFIAEQAKVKGVSKDKFIAKIIDSFLNDAPSDDSYKSICKVQDKKIKALKDENERLKEELDKLKAHNVRGAGRKSKFSEIEIYEMKDYKDQGYTYGQIADIFKCSVGLVHKLINE